MADWYCNFGNGTSTGYYAVAQFAVLTPYTVGQIIRQLAVPAVGSERCFRCTTLGTSGASESAWTLTKGSTTTQGTAVFTEVTGNSTFNWSAPFARIQTPLDSNSWMAAGDRLFVAAAHAETQAAAMNLGATSTSSTPANPIKIICVNQAGSVPPVSADLRTTATVTTTGANSMTFNIALNVYFYFYGITFAAGTGAGSQSLALRGSSSLGYLKFEVCVLSVPGSGSTSITFSGSGLSAGYIELLNTQMSFGGTSANVLIQNTCQLLWRDTVSALQGTIPTTLFSASSTGFVVCDGIDLSGAGSGKTLFGASASALQARLINCKLNAAVTVGAVPTILGCSIDTIISDSSATMYNGGRIQYGGTQTIDTANFLNGGASDGVNSYSWKIVSSANANLNGWFEAFQMAVWNPNTGGTVNATVQIINDGTTLTNADIWVEFEVMDQSGAPLATLHTTGLADPLAVSANLTTSAVTWTTSGISSPVKQLMTVAVTPTIAGWIRGTVKMAKPSKILWVDPEIVLS